MAQNELCEVQINPASLNITHTHMEYCDFGMTDVHRHFTTYNHERIKIWKARIRFQNFSYKAY